MRQLQLPFYQPIFPAPERAVLTLLHASLQVAVHALRDAYPLFSGAVGEPPCEPGETVILSAARLIVGRCVELREQVDLYDTLLDCLRAVDNDSVDF